MGLLVAFSTCEADKSFHTVLTAIRFFSGVNPHVRLEIAESGEVFLALAAHEQLLPRVHTAVAFEVFGLREASTALRTRKRFLSGVRAFVLSQSANLGELSITLVTFVRFLAGVSSRVCHEVTEILKLFATRSACKWSFPRVNSRMPLVMTPT